MNEYKGIRYIAKPIVVPLCKIRDCNSPATKVVNLPPLAGYMEERVCDKHVHEMVEYLNNYVPKDR